MNGILIALLIAILGVQVQGESTEALDQTKFIEESKCLDKEKLVFADVLEFALEDKMELAEKNPKLKCFSSCLLEFGKLLDGCSVVFDKNADTVPGVKKDAFVKLMDDCKSAVKGTDRCECGYQLIKCMTEKGKGAY